MLQLISQVVVIIDIVLYYSENKQTFKYDFCLSMQI